MEKLVSRDPAAKPPDPAVERVVVSTSGPLTVDLTYYLRPGYSATPGRVHSIVQNLEHHRPVGIYYAVRVKENNDE